MYLIIVVTVYLIVVTVYLLVCLNKVKKLKQLITQQGSKTIIEIDGGVSVGEAEILVLDYLQQHIPEGQRAPLAGNSIGTDRAFLTKQMPRLDNFLHYRNVDVSSIKELARRWYPRAYFNSPPKEGSHRALTDIRESIRELAYYRDAIMVAAPGPSSDEAAAAAKRASSAL